ILCRFMSAYTKPAPYTKPQTYDGGETALPIVAPNNLGSTGLRWLDADDHFARTEFDWQQAQASNVPIAAPWERLDAFSRSLSQAWQQANQFGFDAGLPWSKPGAFAAALSAPWLQANPFDRAAAMPWAQFRQRLATQTGLPWITPDAHGFAAALPWATLAAYSASKSLLWKRLGELGAHIALPWGTGSNYQTGYRNPFVNPPDDGSSLVFPDLPVYIMIPTITAVVTAGGADLDPLALTVDEDVDSFCASFEMQIPGVALPLIDPGASGPTPISVTMNGYPWSLQVESYTDNRKFGARGFTVRGRGLSAAFADAPARTLLQADDYNAAQLAQHEVDPTGWTVIWDAVDWLVPGGTFSYNDLAPIAAIQQLASAVGAVVLTDPDALTIRVEPRYPNKPWEWGGATPYAIVPAALLDAVSGDWRGGANPNGIYVYPKNATSGAFVRITGSAGDVQLPMVVETI